MNVNEIIGVTGASLVALSFIPQTYRTLTTHRADDISASFLGINMVSSILMLWYGFREWSFPVLVSNGSVLMNITAIAYVKLRHRKHEFTLEEAKHTLSG
jgi:uncharacterized protein with PQ loop repeat